VPDAHKKNLFEIGCAYGFFLSLAKNTFHGSAAVDVLRGVSMHLLLFHYALADHLVHRRFNEVRVDRLAVSVALAEVRDELLIVADVGLEFAYTLGHLLRQWLGNLGKLQIDKEAF
jgi:hypothetical protein